jgi:hypothetical protein
LISSYLTGALSLDMLSWRSHAQRLGRRATSLPNSTWNRRHQRSMTRNPKSPGLSTAWSAVPLNRQRQPDIAGPAERVSVEEWLSA